MYRSGGGGVIETKINALLHALIRTARISTFTSLGTYTIQILFLSTLNLHHFTILNVNFWPEIGFQFRQNGNTNASDEQHSKSEQTTQINIYMFLQKE